MPHVETDVRAVGGEEMGELVEPGMQQSDRNNSWQYARHGITLSGPTLHIRVGTFESSGGWGWGGRYIYFCVRGAPAKARAWRQGVLPPEADDIRCQPDGTRRGGIRGQVNSHTHTQREGGREEGIPTGAVGLGVNFIFDFTAALAGREVQSAPIETGPITVCTHNTGKSQSAHT